MKLLISSMDTLVNPLKNWSEIHRSCKTASKQLFPVKQKHRRMKNTIAHIDVSRDDRSTAPVL
jgi:hypothetical protein